MENVEKMKHPKGLHLVNVVTVLQNLYAYGIIGFLILFFTASTAENGLGLDRGFASELYGYYGALGYMMALVGGWLADKYLGIQKSIILGTLFSCFGYVALYFSTSELWTVIASLLLLLIAAGIGKGNISALVGALYERDQVTMKDAAYSIYYMAINIGSLFGPIIFGLMTDSWFAKVGSDGKVISYGYRYGFLVAAALAFVQFLVFALFAPSWLKEKGKYPVASKKAKKSVNHPLTKIDIDRMKAMAILFVFSTLFWSAWYQTQTSFAILTQKAVDRTIFGWTVPTPWLISFNGLLCAALAPAFGALWVKLSKTKHGDLDTGTKMGLGMILSGIAFGVMILGVNTIGGNIESGAKMNISYILITYVLLTIGELLLSPIGMSLFNKLSPAKYASLSMGIWYMTFSLSNIISGYLAKLTVKLSFTQVFTYIGAIVLIFGIVLLLIKGRLNDMMHIDKLEEEAKAIAQEEN
ncbi:MULTISPECIES: peptide MFS transporter [Gemella]|uniref:peptide MFS transporter n=1 Tax=Gemella TaxID=1378 RepID=UPI0007681789|nr:MULTISPECIES: peptide MFS transporter [Gemella]AME09024.1 amino acid transporter [Gemella sp. oral taxon 928]AXI26594.1 MFS transporter [Gemella sp. ND 6198]